MIIRNRSCCNGRRFKGFGAAINDFDSFIAGVMGAGTDMNRMLLVVSEWLCPSYWERLWGYGTWQSAMLQVLTEMERPDVAGTFLSATMRLVQNRSIHREASCAGAVASSATGASTGATIDQIIAWGKQGVSDTKDLLEDKNEQPVTNNPPGTKPGTTTTTTTKKTTNWSLIIGAVAAVAAGGMLLAKKRK